MFIFLVEQLRVGTHCSSLMHDGVKHTVHSRKIVVAVPV